MLCGSGGAPRAAIAMGRGDDDAAEKIMGNCFTLLLILAAVLTVVFYFAAPSLLVLFGASEKTLPYALDYARIYIIGTIFVLIVMGMNPFVTTQGFATFSMMTTVIGAVCNIILDPILIFALNMGVRGAATATVISQAVGAVWVLRFLTGSRTRLRLSVKNMPLVGKVIGPCLGLGVSTFVMIATESILSISFNSSLARYGGDIAVGAMTIITSATQLLSMPVQGLCQGAQPIMSFNFGAGKGDRVNPGVSVTVHHLRGICSRVLGRLYAGAPDVCEHLLHRSGTGAVHGLGHARLHGGYFLHRVPGFLPAEFCGAGPSQDQSVHGLPAQADFADSPDLYPAPDFAGQGFCCLFGRAGQRYHRGNRNLQRILYPL